MLKGEGFSFGDGTSTEAVSGIASGRAVFAPSRAAPGRARATTGARSPRTSWTIFGSTTATAMVGSDPLRPPPLPDPPEPPEAPA